MALGLARRTLFVTEGLEDGDLRRPAGGKRRESFEAQTRGMDVIKINLDVTCRGRAVSCFEMGPVRRRGRSAAIMGAAEVGEKRKLFPRQRGVVAMMNALAQTTFRHRRWRDRQRNGDEVPQQREEQEQFGGQAMHTLFSQGRTAERSSPKVPSTPRSIVDRRIAAQEANPPRPKMLRNS